MWCKKWRTAINATKSQHLIFRRIKTRRPIRHKIRIFNQEVPMVRQAKYLGITFRDNLCWDTHIDIIIRKVKAIRSAIFPLIGSRSELHYKLKANIINAMIRATISYASPVWAAIPPSYMKRLSGIYNRILRSSLNAPRYFTNSNLFRELSIPNLEQFLNQTNAKFFKRHLVQDDHFSNCLKYPILEQTKTFRPLVAVAMKNPDVLDLCIRY